MTVALPLTPDAEAVTVTLFGEGIEAGAVYLPVTSMVPTVELPPCTPLTLQVTVTAIPLLDAALNCWLAPRATVAELGETVRLGGGGGGVELPPPPQETSIKANRQAMLIFSMSFIVQTPALLISRCSSNNTAMFDAEQHRLSSAEKCMYRGA